jgi:hypothetical protein
MYCLGPLPIDLLQNSSSLEGLYLTVALAIMLVIERQTLATVKAALQSYYYIIY